MASKDNGKLPEAEVPINTQVFDRKMLVGVRNMRKTVEDIRQISLLTEEEQGKRVADRAACDLEFEDFRRREGPRIDAMVAGMTDEEVDKLILKKVREISITMTEIRQIRLLDAFDNSTGLQHPAI
jgi:hypothetical protein